MKKNKVNWGTGILITIIIFVVITIGAVIFLMNQDVDLVASDYYDKGIHHQEQIDRMNRTIKLGGEISINPGNGFVRLTLPKSFLPKSLTGTIQFYRPSDEKKDFAVALDIDTSAQQLISTQSMEKGFWKVRVIFTQDKVEYYKESSFVIN